MEPAIHSSPMSRVRFHAGDIDLELSGSEPFVLRQLKLLGTFLGRVDADALGEVDAVPAAPVAETAPELVAAPAAPSAPPPGFAAPQPFAAAGEVAEPRVAAAAPTNGGHAAAPARPVNGGVEAQDDLLVFYRGFQPAGLDRQSDAALLFAYYLQQREGVSSLQIGDLIRCCIRAGVDTRNFNRTLGTLTRRGYLETARQGHGYRLSDNGVAAVESRM